MFLKRLKGESGQSTTELVFILPILFLIFLFTLQMIVILSNQEQAQMSVWMGLRGHSLRGWRSLVGFKPMYSDDQVKNMIKGGIKRNEDEGEVKVNVGTSGVSYESLFLFKLVKVDIEYSFPYLFKGLSWQPIRDVFETWLTEDDIKVKASGRIAETRAY